MALPSSVNKNKLSGEARAFCMLGLLSGLEDGGSIFLV
jgi:hypothetical protein